jgi:hypothetical protein
MKTRQLMACDSEVFVRHVKPMKPKQLIRHIEKVIASLGAPDPQVLFDCVLTALREPPAEGWEQGRIGLIVDALTTQIPRADENEEAVMRLALLYMELLRHAVRRMTRGERPGGPTGQDHPHCGDPDCDEHGHHHHPG